MKTNYVALSERKGCWTSFKFYENDKDAYEESKLTNRTGVVVIPVDVVRQISQAIRHNRKKEAINA